MLVGYSLYVQYLLPWHNFKLLLSPIESIEIHILQAKISC
jgi:hypothetical protein